MTRNRGFTLLEILVALFIFTILSLILTGALHNVLNAVSGTEGKAERLRQLQIALLMMSRDVSQAINRPVLNASGKMEAAFIGAADGFAFTQAGIAFTETMHSGLQRKAYRVQEEKLERLTWAVLDQAPTTKPHQRVILTDATDVHFQYLDKKGLFSDEWPLANDQSQPLPRAVRVYLTIAKWGSMSQLYVIAAQGIQQQPAKPESQEEKPL